MSEIVQIGILATLLGLSPINDMQTPTRSEMNGQIYMKDAHCAETIEKSIFLFLRFLVFEI